jgi:tRNA A-37 threonylcarbamoyl transferase component Bud32
VRGAKLGDGGSSEVFAWGEDGRHALKLFRPEYGFAADREARCTRDVHDAGVASPAVYDTVEVDGRRGIILDRFDGPTLLEQLLRGDRPARDVGAVLASVHLEMHAIEVGALPDLAAAVKERGLDFPPGSTLFHGDFHPGNVIVTADGPRTIDWVNAHRAPRAADVAMTVMAVRYLALRSEQEDRALGRERRARAQILDAYMSAYLAAQPAVQPELAFWLRQAANALLRQEPASADADDLHALAEARLDDVREPVLARLLR